MYIRVYQKLLIHEKVVSLHDISNKWGGVKNQ